MLSLHCMLMELYYSYPFTSPSDLMLFFLVVKTFGIQEGFQKTTWILKMDCRGLRGVFTCKSNERAISSGNLNDFVAMSIVLHTNNISM